MSDLNTKCERKHTKKGKNIYSTQTRSQNSHENLLNACHPKELNKADLDLPEMSPSFENPFKTKFSKMHNFAANHLCSKICYCEYGER